MSKDRGVFFENLDCYVILRLLAENPANLDKEVVWWFHDVVSGGYVKSKDIFDGLDPSFKYLIVTEGTSDSTILRKSLQHKFPEVSDFFNFIDVEDNYPFSGAGNLASFCIGLSTIKVTNKVVFVIDNDSAGHEALIRIKDANNTPENIKILVLPDLDEFRDFLTIGPSGIMQSNINGKAVAIEHFLDLHYNKQEKPIVKWTSYNKRTDTYQGELSGKDQYVKEFHKNYTNPDYNKAKLEVIWRCIFKLCSGETKS